METVKPRLSSADKEARRKLAVRNVLGGRPQVDVAKFLGVHPVTVAKWMARYRADHEKGLDAREVPGRPRFLTADQEAEVLGWLTQKPSEFGFRTDLWTAARVAQLVEQRMGVKFHPSYLREWLTKRNHSPQKPKRRAKQKNDAEIARWLKDDYPEIKKK
jgi:transposase